LILWASSEKAIICPAQVLNRNPPFRKISLTMKRSLLSSTTLSLRAKRRLRASNLRCAAAVSALTMMGSTSSLLSATLYWDVNGTTAGFSTVVGAWNGTNSFWNTDSAGGAGTLSAIPTSADDLFIQPATTNTGSITLSGATKNASSITFAADVGPTTTLTGGTINIGGTGAVSGIRQQSTGANTISSALQLNSGNTAFEFSNSSTGLLTIGGSVTGTATSGNVTQDLTIGSSSSGGITFGGIIADVSGSATKVALTVNNTSTGITTLTGANTYTGGTIISAGTLSVGSGSTTGSITGDVANSGMLTFNRSNSLTYGGIVSGTGAVTKSGAGTLTLTGANTYTGVTTINAGTLSVGSGSTSGSIAGNVANSGTLTFNRSDALTYGGVVSGTGAVTKSGAGTLTLTGANSYDGTTTISVGSLNLQHATGLGSTVGATSVASGAALQLEGGITVGAEALTLNGTGVGSTGALLNVSGDNTYGGAITRSGATTTIGSTAGTLTLSGTMGGNVATTFTGAGNITSSGVISGTAAIAKSGAGTLTLTGANSYDGTTTISAGSVNLQNATGLGSTAGGTSVANNAALQLEGGITVGAEALTLTGTGVSGTGALLNVSGDNTFGGAITRGGATTIGSTAGTLTLSGTMGGNVATTFTGAGNITSSGVISGTGAVTKSGAGTLTLSGANTYTGLTTVSEGTLLYGASDVISTGAVTVNGATAILDLGANQSDSVGTVTLQGGGQINGSGTSTLTSTGTFAMQSGSVSAILAGSGAFNKTTADTVTLSGANTYTGLTTVSDGTLLYGASNVISTGGVTVNGATAILDLGANQSDSVGTVTLRGGGQINGTGTSTLTSTGTFAMESGSVSAILAGSAALTKSTANTVTLSGANTYTGGTTVSAGTLIGTTSSLQGAITNNATLEFNQATDGAYAGVMSGSGSLNKLGVGITTLSAANTFTGTTTISGGKVALTDDLALQNSAYNTTGSNGTTIGMDVSDPSALNSGSLTLGGLSGAVDLAGAFTAGFTGSVTNLTLNPQTGKSNTYSGVIADGASGMTLTKTGAGTQTLSGDNTYTGDTYVNQGNLTITHNNALGTTAGITVVNTNAAKLNLNNASGLTVAEPISFSGGNISGSDLESVIGANTLSGPVTLSPFARILVTAGSLTFTGGITSTSTGTSFVMNPAAGTTLAVTTTPIDLTNSGFFWHDSGTGVSALGVTGNTFGAASVSTGTIRLDVANALPSIAYVNIGHNFGIGGHSGGTLDLNGNSQKIFGLQHTTPNNGVLTNLVVTSATAATLTLDSSTLGGDPARLSTTPYLYGGNITGALSIVKEGPNTATFSGANTYTGDTTINGGTLALGSAGALGSSGTIAFGGGTLQHSASNTTDYSGRFSTAASQQYSIDTNGQSVSLATALTSSGGSFTKLGAGTLTLTGANTYDGMTTINGGVLAVTNGAAIANTGAVTLADVSGATFTVQNSETIGSLRGGGVTGGNVSIASAQTLTVAETGSQTFAGIISDAGGLTKTGAGTLTLTGTNTYTGATTVSAGQLVVNGSSSGSAHTVGAGGTLGGIGTVGTLVVQNGGTISPGNSPGILNVNGNTTWQNGGNYNWQLLDATGTAGTGWDQLAITGALDLAGLTAGGFNVNVWSLSSALVNGNALNFDGIGGVYSWPIATTTTGITGFNANNFFIDTAAVNGTNGFTNSFAGGTFSMSQTGNNLYLNYQGPTPVPEPANAVTVLALFSGAVLQRRKRVVKH
jgi:fibronectin-binding autotransporter adhesin